MIGGPGLTVGLDVGSAKTCAVILEPPEHPGGEDRVAGVGLARTEGMRQEKVTNLEATTRSIRESLREAEIMAGREVESVYVGLAGSHVRVDTSSGVVAVSGDEIRASDVERVHEVGQAVVVPPDRELLHAIPHEYAVDGRGGIQDPVGMAGTRLEAEVCIVTAGSGACRDLRRAVDRAGYRVEELVLEPLAGSLAVLREEEREAGVALIEVGGATTDVAAFLDDRLRLVASLPWGGHTVTGDVVKGLGVQLEVAERLKRDYGAALSGRVEDEKIEVPGPTAGSTRRVSRDLLAHIIEQRMDEIFGLVYEELEEAGLLDALRRGLVLTGGGSTLPGTVELAQDVFNAPVRPGEPGRGLAGLVDAIRRPKFATATGLAMYGNLRRRGRHGGAAARALTRVGEWLRDFF